MHLQFCLVIHRACLHLWAQQHSLQIPRPNRSFVWCTFFVNRFMSSCKIFLCTESTFPCLAATQMSHWSFLGMKIERLCFRHTFANKVRLTTRTLASIALLENCLWTHSWLSHTELAPAMTTASKTPQIFPSSRLLSASSNLYEKTSCTGWRSMEDPSP